MTEPALATVVSAAARLGSCACPEPSRCQEPIEELATLGNADPRRRDDFLRGRIAARRALRSLGIEARSIPIGAWRQPVWPPGVVGSISHSAGVAVAVAAGAEDLRGIGVDVEMGDRRLSPATVRRILTPPERWALEEQPGPAWPLVLFCAKEAAFKAVFQAYGRRLVSGDLAFRPPATPSPSGELGCRLRHPRQRLRARYALSDGLLVTCVELGLEDGSGAVPG